MWEASSSFSAFNLKILETRFATKRLNIATGAVESMTVAL